MINIYKYDKSNRLSTRLIGSLMHLTVFKYKNNFRKLYFKCKNPESTQITKEELRDGSYKTVSSLTFLGEMWVYNKYDINGKEEYSKMFTKKRTVFEIKTLINVGDSSIKEMTFTKNNKKEKHIKIETKRNGTDEYK